jgi:hypothetical protein
MADYRRTVAEARRRRDARIAEAERQAHETIAAAVAERDAEIRRLSAAGVAHRRIAPLVGCSAQMVYEVMHPERRARYNERRRKHARRHLTLAA